MGPGNHWNALLDVVQNDSRVTLDSDTCHFFHPLYIITKSGSVCMHVETNQSIRNYGFFWGLLRNMYQKMKLKT